MRSRYKQLVEAKALVLENFDRDLKEIGKVLFHNEIRDVFVKHPNLDRIVFDFYPEKDKSSRCCSNTTLKQLQSIPDQEVSLYGELTDTNIIYDNLKDIFQLFEEGNFLDIIGCYGEHEFERENYVPEPDEE